VKFGIYAIYDSKAEAFARPFFFPTKGMAMRAFTDHVSDPSTPVGQHPADYTLFHIGEWDDHEGHIQMREAKESMGSGIQYLPGDGQLSEVPR